MQREEEQESKGLLEIMFDSKDGVIQPLIPTVLCALRNLTKVPNNEKLGNLMGFKCGSVAVSTMKDPNHPSQLRKEKLIKLSENIKMPFPDLMKKICTSLLYVEDDTETKSKREAFLAGLHSASINSGKGDFNKLINGQLHEFKYGNGIAPFEWLSGATPDTEEQIRLIVAHCGKATPKSEKEPDTQKKCAPIPIDDIPGVVQIKTENSDVPSTDTDTSGVLWLPKASTEENPIYAKKGPETPGPPEVKADAAKEAENSGVLSTDTNTSGDLGKPKASTEENPIEAKKEPETPEPPEIKADATNEAENSGVPSTGADTSGEFGKPRESTNENPIVAKKEKETLQHPKEKEHKEIELGQLFDRVEEIQLLNAISLASQNAGTTKRLKLEMSADVFLGTVILQMLRRNFSIELGLTTANKKQPANPHIPKTDVNVKLGSNMIKLVFKGENGKFFSWKVDPGEFLSDRVDMTKGK